MSIKQEHCSRELVAACLGLSSVQLWRWVKAGRFPPADIQERGRSYWSSALVAAALKRIEDERLASLAERRAQISALFGTDALGAK